MGKWQLSMVSSYIYLSSIICWHLAVQLAGFCLVTSAVYSASIETRFLTNADNKPHSRAVICSWCDLWRAARFILLIKPIYVHKFSIKSVLFGFVEESIMNRLFLSLIFALYGFVLFFLI